jgi:hypothetical protein
MSQTVSYLWREPRAADGFTAGVSLHSHTNQSKETLDFIAELSTDWGVLQPLMRWAERRCLRTTGIRPDYARSYWTPPLTPRLAFDLERQQIEEKLQLAGHGLAHRSRRHPGAHAAALAGFGAADSRLAGVDGALWFVRGAVGLPPGHPQPAQRHRRGVDAAHGGVHGHPGGRAPAKLLTEMLAELDELPGVLIVFNHPLWDLYRIGEEKHRFLVNEFLAVYGQFCHAVELNGLRHWDENREVATLARQWNQVLISGGDRHGIEPNANLNLTRAASFTEFVHEVRRERQSHVLFMPQYAEPWKHRILNSTLAAIRNYPEFPEGSRRWDDRVYHPDAEGNSRQLSELWRSGHAPVYLSAVLAFVRLLGAAPVSSGLRLAWNDASAMRSALAERKA